MKIFEVAGQGKLHGLTVMSLDAFVKKEDDVEEGQVNEIDRRGFLKGLGAAAVAGAGYIGGANKVGDKRVAQTLGMVYGFLDNAPGAYSIGSPFNKIVRDTHQRLEYFEKRLDPDIKYHDWFTYGKGQGERAYQSEFGDTKEFSADDMKRFNSILRAHVKHFEEAAYGSMKESVEQGVAEGDISGLMHAAKNYNRSFLITAELAEGGKKTFRVHAQSERAAREKFAQHHNQAQILKVKEEGIAEAPGDFGLGANYRAIPDDEMQALMGRSKNKTKTKRDKYDYPYIHGSNIEVKDESGKKFDTEKLKAAIMTRPTSILGQNAKMQHSETGNEAIFDIGLPALKGLAVNEKTGEFVVVDTCPGAGACQTYCYAMKGSYVMFKAVSMGLARMLNFLLNDPEGFAAKLNQEIASAKAKYAKKGARIVVRWHDAGDFFSPEYLDMAYKVAEANPDVGFYAYTKMGDVANAARPRNFNMNFSQGAKTGQEKKVNITRTKHSKVVPKDMFFDLIARKGNELIKDAKGRMQFASPENLDKFKTIMAQKYAIDKNSILTYDQMMKTPVGEEPKWNVIVMPGDGDNSANRNDVIGSYLLFH